MRRRLVARVSLLCALCGCDPNVIVGYAPELGGDPPMDAGAGTGGRGSGGAGSNASVAGTGGSAGSEPVAGMDAGVVAPVDAGVDAMVDAGPLPEVNWVSGAHPGTELQSYLDWGSWRGHPVDIAQVYSDRLSWSGVTEPGWLIDIFRPYPGQLSMSQPLFPEGGMGNLEDCAAGMYDANWRRFGTFLVDNDRPDMIVRVGWGLNDPDKEWRVGADPVPWKECFRKVVSAIRATAPRIQIEWSVNSYVSSIPAGGDPFTAYPGDEFVDIVGMDVYDQNPSVHDEAEWDARCNGVSGLCRLMEFARAHGKRAGVGEWGVSSCGTDPGGDNPFFIQKMYETFAMNRDILAYEAYFNDTGAGVCSSLREVGGVTQNPLSAERYRQLYGPR